MVKQPHTPNPPHAFDLRLRVSPRKNTIYAVVDSTVLGGLPEYGGLQMLNSCTGESQGARDNDEASRLMLEEACVHHDVLARCEMKPGAKAVSCFAGLYGDIAAAWLDSIVEKLP